MRKSLVLITTLLVLLSAGLARRELLRLSTPPSLPAAPQRIISLAPSVTETLYALGLGPKVVGVTQFCTYPPEVRAKARVAGFSSVNLEAVVRARPDLVVLPTDKTVSKKLIEGLGIPVLPLDTRSLPGLLQAIERLGAATGRREEAGLVTARFQLALQTARARAAGRTRPRVLFSVMHSYQGLGYITEINAVGQDGFYNELIEAAGGENAYSGMLAFPRLSRESIVFLDPDVIIDVIPANEDLAAVRRDWQSLDKVAAIRTGRLFLLTDAADTVPGPRSIHTLRKLSQAFHPDPPVPSPEHPLP